ncbi:MAG TPA: nicotinate-nucleotide adenylyltransferase [Rhodocyclaceae bacterium]|nr:nicotinate-nucleotide adenylyltransferase [Rhodocyclaceae bacterium]
MYSVSTNVSDTVGVFGGTFDPVHVGHLRLAEEAREHLGLARVLWVPAGQPPHRGGPTVSAAHRLAMVRAATAGNPMFQVDPAEVESAQPSYTVLTLERLRALHGAHSPLVLLLGADAFAGLPGWHRWQEIFSLAHVAVAHRPGFPVTLENLPTPLAAVFESRRIEDPARLAESPAGTIVTFAMTQLAVSATQIRQLLANGKSTHYLLPEAVIAYIHQHHLYQPI